MTKEQLQFFYNEIMGMFGWDDGDEASGVDPLLWAKKEYEIRNVKLAQLRAENKNDKKMLAEDGLVFLQCFRLLGMDESGASTKDIPAAIKRLRAELDAANKAVEEARGVMEAIKNRIDYLQNLWGREGVTDNVLDILSNWLTAHQKEQE